MLQTKCLHDMRVKSKQKFCQQWSCVLDHAKCDVYQLKDHFHQDIAEQWIFSSIT
jgi:hypothetical protein